MLNTFVNPHRWAMYWTSYIFCWWRLVGFWKNVWNCGTHPIWWWGLQPFGSHSFVSHVNFHSHSLSISPIECLLLRCSWSHLFWHHLFFLLWDSFSAVAALPFVIWSKVAAMCAIAISAINQYVVAQDGMRSHISLSSVWILGTNFSPSTKNFIPFLFEIND